jgi:hypothetical protein
MNLLFQVQIVQNILFGMKICVLGSGVLIAFWCIKSLKWKRFYFGLYPLGLTLFLLGFVVRGIFGGLLMSVTTYPIIKDEVAYQKDEAVIYTKYKGLFSSCCTYKVSEKKFMLFEKNYGQFEAEGQSELTIKTIQNSQNQLKVTYEDYAYDKANDDLILKDITLTFNK